jgi:hypothetical protein
VKFESQIITERGKCESDKNITLRYAMLLNKTNKAKGPTELALQNPQELIGT